MSERTNLWKAVDHRTQKLKNPVQVGQILSKNPFLIKFNGVEIGSKYNDNIYVNNLLLDDNINLDIASLDEAQNFTSSTAYQSPSFTAKIDGTQKQFLIDFYNYFKQWQKRYIIDIGDFVAVQKLGQNTYIVLEKVQNEQ